MLDYMKTCKQCGKEFTGRKNKEYCGEKCKADFNNEKASLLRKQLVDSLVMQKNFILLSEFKAHYGNEPFLVNKIIKRGFDSSAPTRKIKTPINGSEIFLVHTLGYRTYSIDTNIYMVLYDKKDLDNL